MGNWASFAFNFEYWRLFLGPIAVKKNQNKLSMYSFHSENVFKTDFAQSFEHVISFYLGNFWVFLTILWFHSLNKPLIFKIRCTTCRIDNFLSQIVSSRSMKNFCKLNQASSKWWRVWRLAQNWHSIVLKRAGENSQQVFPTATQWTGWKMCRSWSSAEYTVK